MGIGLFALSIGALAVIHYHLADLYSFFRPSEFGYNLMILMFAMPIVFATGTVFPRSIKILNGERLASEIVFGINLAGLAVGTIIALVANMVWGLNVSYVLLISLMLLLSALSFFPVRQDYIPKRHSGGSG